MGESRGLPCILRDIKIAFVKVGEHKPTRILFRGTVLGKYVPK